MKKWLINNFLPRWAKECVFHENEVLKRQVSMKNEQVKQLKRENLQLKDQIRRLQSQLNR